MSSQMFFIFIGVSSSKKLTQRTVKEMELYIIPQSQTPMRPCDAVVRTLIMWSFWVQIPASPIYSCVFLGRSLHDSEP